MNLLDTIYEVPQIIRVTDSNSRKALQATCRQLRRLVHATASVVSFGTQRQSSEADARLLSSGTWTSLKAMNFKHADLSADAIAVLSQGDWPLLKILVLSNNLFGARGMEHFSHGRWPALATLELHQVGMSFTMMQHLQHATLACLSSLDLSENVMANSACWAELVKGDWPNLTRLDLSSNNIDIGFVGQLKTAKWPLLGSLNLHFAFCQHSATAQREALQGMAQCDWHNLQSLGLASCSLGPEAMQKLCQAQWPDLRILDLTANSMSGDAIRYLAGSVWSQLEVLDLKWCDIDVAAVSCLVQAKWLRLKALNLSGNDIHVDALDLLVEAQWPLLIVLDLSRNHLGTGSAVRLNSGHELPLKSGRHIVTPPAWLLKQWPKLSVLDLSYCNIEF